MTESKIQIKVGIVEFSGEGSQDWLAEQLDKILIKVPDLLRIELSNNGNVNDPKEVQANTDSLGKGNTETNNGLTSTNLVSFLKEKNAVTNQVKKFLATAAFLQLKGKNRIVTSDVTEALKNSNQSKLSNASDCLLQNIRKGFCEKDSGREFFVTSNGLSELDLEG